MTNGKTQIPSANAKNVLIKIDEILDREHLLIGGLAVKQYVPHRQSEDIDLVCDNETAAKIIKEIFPTEDYNILDKNDDEYRPSFEISSRTDSERVYFIGPKIIEREPYDYLTWSILQTNSREFRVKNTKLEKIRVPSSEALAYSKLLSLLNRLKTNPTKGAQDLQDFVDLTNFKYFNLNLFVDIIRNQSSQNYISDRFSELKDLINLDDFKKTTLLFSNEQLFKITPSVRRRDEVEGNDYETVFLPSNSEEFYNRIADLYDIRNTKFLYNAHQKIIEKVRNITDVISKPNIVDIGCGTGRLIASHFMHEELFHWHGIDGSELMTKLFSENLQQGKMSFENTHTKLDSSNLSCITETLSAANLLILSFVLTSFENEELYKSIIKMLPEDCEILVADIHPKYTIENPYYDFVESNGVKIALKPSPIYPDRVSNFIQEIGGHLLSHDIIKHQPTDEEYAFVSRFKLPVRN